MNAFACLVTITKESKELATFPQIPSAVMVYAILKYFEGIKSWWGSFLLMYLGSRLKRPEWFKVAKKERDKDINLLFGMHCSTPVVPRRRLEGSFCRPFFGPGEGKHHSHWAVEDKPTLGARSRFSVRLITTIEHIPLPIM